MIPDPIPLIRVFLVAFQLLLAGGDGEAGVGDEEVCAVGGAGDMAAVVAVAKDLHGKLEGDVRIVRLGG